MNTSIDNRELTIQGLKILVACAQQLGSKLRMPQHLVLLTGAPGAGKETHAPYIQQILGIDSQPIVISSLLKTPEVEEIKATGALVDDTMVTRLMLTELGKPEHKKGAIIDGYCRTLPQAKLIELCSQRLGQHTSLTLINLHICIEESIARQRERAKKAIDAGKKARPTDLDEEGARKRHGIYMEETRPAVRWLMGQIEAGKIPNSRYIDVSANGTPEEVRADIAQQLREVGAVNADVMVA